ncbi:hypothetical protein J9303_12975 [Bacillaceae bacterium Marseille-Q3522]|nr:hypothetical protein [Bacillaceae bacterium Marseille-Q3522]
MDRRRSLPSIQMVKQPYGLAPGLDKKKSGGRLVIGDKLKTSVHKVRFMTLCTIGLRPRAERILMLSFFEIAFD